MVVVPLRSGGGVEGRGVGGVVLGWGGGGGNKK